MKLLYHTTMFAVLFLLFSSMAFGLGISPGSKEFNLNGDSNLNYQLRVYNNDNKDMDVQISYEGLLKDYVRIEPNQLSFAKGEDVKTINILVNIPSNLLNKDYEKEKIKAREIVKTQNVFATLEVVSFLNFKAGNAEKKELKDVNIKLDVNNTPTKTLFNLGVTNAGNTRISKTDIIIETADFDNKTISSIKSDSFSLDINQKKFLSLNAGKLGPAVYKAVIYANYDNKAKVIEKEFIINLVDWNKTEYIAEAPKPSKSNIYFVIVLWIFVPILIIINMIKYKDYIMARLS